MLAKPFTTLPIDDDQVSASLANGNVLRNLIFKYISDPLEVTKVLFELIMAQMKPHLIIIDFLHTYFSDINNLPSANMKDDLYREFIRQHMLMIAAVKNTTDTLVKYINADCCSIVCVDTTVNKVYERFKQSIVDLYYCKENVVFNCSHELLKTFGFN